MRSVAFRPLVSALFYDGEFGYFLLGQQKRRTSKKTAPSAVA
jgi:hypothetical protein